MATPGHDTPRHRHQQLGALGWLGVLVICAGVTTLGSVAPLLRAQVPPGTSPRASSATLAFHGRVAVTNTDLRLSPLRHARVSMTPESGDSSAPPVTAMTVADTDADGRFHIDGLQAGTYRVNVSKAGYLPARGAPGAVVTVPRIDASPGRDIDGEFLMERAAALDGSIVDASGDPVARTAVFADRLASEGPRGSDAATYETSTDDLGRFRFHTLPGGSYLIRTRFLPPLAVEERYFPGTTRRDDAQVLVVSVGEEVNHLEFNAGDRQNSASDQPPAAATSEGATRVSGRVLRSDSGRPLSDALIQLNQDGRAAAIARTDARGQFAISGLAPGAYALSVTATGFLSRVRPRASSVPVLVVEHERLDLGDLLLARLGAIDGRILDEWGDALPGVTVQIPLMMSADGPFPVPTPSNVQTIGPTDDLGHFRLYNLPPGDYPVMGLAGAFGRSGSSAFSTVVNPLVGFAPTWYPGTDQVDASKPVHVGDGLDAFDVTFAMMPATMHALGGVITNARGEHPTLVNLMLLPTTNGGLRVVLTAGALSRGDGSFEFHNVPAGSYVLQAFGDSEFSATPVVVPETGPPIRVNLTLRPRTTARGRILFEGQAPLPKSSQVGVFFAPSDFMLGPVGGNRSPSTVSDDWDFEIHDLASTGLVRATAPGSWLLTRVTVAGRDISGVPYDFQTTDVSGMQIVFTSRVGSLAGVVLDRAKPVAECAVMIFSVERDPMANPGGLTAVVQSDSAGQFAIPALLPGRYLAAATTLGSNQITLQSLTPLRASAAPFTVKEGEKASLTIQLKRQSAR